jgi:predicted nucleic acid-binding protein
VGVPQPQNPSPGKGAGVRAEYGLSYFDSLHATAAISTGATLVSFDKRYAGIRGLAYLHASVLLEELEGS